MAGRGKTIPRNLYVDDAADEDEEEEEEEDAPGAPEADEAVDSDADVDRTAKAVEAGGGAEQDREGEADGEAGDDTVRCRSGLRLPNTCGLDW